MVGVESESSNFLLLYLQKPKVQKYANTVQKNNNNINFQLSNIYTLPFPSFCQCQHQVKQNFLTFHNLWLHILPIEEKNEIFNSFNSDWIKLKLLLTKEQHHLNFLQMLLQYIHIFKNNLKICDLFYFKIFNWFIMPLQVSQLKNKNV